MFLAYSLIFSAIILNDLQLEYGKPYQRLFLGSSSQFIIPQNPQQMGAALASQAAYTFHIPSLQRRSPVQSPYYSVFRYVVQSGDTINSIAARFRVNSQQITSHDPISSNKFLSPGQILEIPQIPGIVTDTPPLLPDGEVIFSESTSGFDTSAFVKQAGGYLSTHREFMRSTGMTSAAEIIARIALENSFNPRLLLALLEYQCGCVMGFPDKNFDTNYLMGFYSPVKKGLYRQLGWAVNQLSLGYYGWRNGLITEFFFPDSDVIHVSPTLNAGSVAIQYLFAQLDDNDDWQKAVAPNTGFAALYADMFGDPWQRFDNDNPLLPGNLSQPELILPFLPGDIWSYTSGPHKAWETDGALAAIDFAPPSAESGCQPSDEWVVAVADGVVTRSELGVVVLDLNDPGYNGYRETTLSDGKEQTGWAILYMHISTKDRVVVGTRVARGDIIGHPSCEGGPASGTHLHIARKFNGEWIAADGPVPFVMDGWVVKADYQPFEGRLVRAGKTIKANVLSPGSSFISRDQDGVFNWNQTHRWKCD